MSKKLLAALLVILATVIAVVGTLVDLDTLLTGPKAEPVAMLSGGEKMAFLRNPATTERLADLGWAVTATKAGSVEMVTEKALLERHRPDVLWPASQVSVEIADRTLPVLGTETVFASPIVLMSWSNVADALVKAGLADHLDGAAYAIDTTALHQAIHDGVTWADLAMPAMAGRLMIQSTEPFVSNSGTQWAILAALTQSASLGEVDARGLSRTAALFRAMGYQPHSSGDMFRSYVTEGFPSKPLVVGYESQVIEYAQSDPASWERLTGGTVYPVILYPRPTLQSTHVAIALTEAGQAFLPALRDPALMDIAWRDHGYRAGPLAADTARALQGLPDTVAQALPLPRTEVIDQVQRALGT